VQRGRKFIAAQCAHEFGIDLRVAFEPGGDVGPCRSLDFADKMPERRRSEAVQVLDEPLPPDSIPGFALILGLPQRGGPSHVWVMAYQRVSATLTAVAVFHASMELRSK
jgi:hypothetical protein